MTNKHFFSHISLTKPGLLLLGLLFTTCHLWGQLDSVHWIPAMHGRDAVDEQYIYLSTPESTPFPVSIYNGAGVLLSTEIISNTSPKKYYIGDDEYTSTMVIPDLLNTVLTNKGLKLIAPKKFYCNFRTKSSAHGGSLTAKGRAALGNTFRIGHLHADGGAHFVGVMASEDNTIVTFSQFRPGVYLQTGNGSNEHILANTPISVILNAGQCYVISQYDKNIQNDFTAGLNGLLVSSTKPIAVNCGSWLGLTVGVSGAADVGIDQIAPLDRCGTEYILMRGDGTSDIEFGIVVAHLDNTEVYINDDPTPFILNAGQRLLIPDSYYFEGNLLIGNMYVRTSEPVFMYQSLGGGEEQNAALNFVPPLSCLIGNEINNIPFVSEIGSNDNFLGSVQIMAFTGLPVQLFANSTPVNLPAPQSVRGNSDYVTYRYNGLPINTVTHVRVLSDGPIQVSIARRSNNIGWGGYFSGFDIEIIPEISIRASAQCHDTLYAQTRNINAGVSWYLNGQLLDPQPSVDTLFINPAPGDYMAIGKYTNTCEDVLYDTAFYNVPDNVFSINALVTPLNCDAQQSGGQVFVQTSGAGSFQFNFNNSGFTTNPVLAVSEPGPVSVTVRNDQGCIKTQEVLVYENLPVAFSPVLCPSESVVVNGTEYNAGSPSGTERILQPGDCDSIVSVSLGFYAPATYELTGTICGSDTLTVGQMAFYQGNIEGVVVLPGLSVRGCDSIVTVQLSYAPTYNQSFTRGTCDPGATGTVVLSLQSQSGCDSTVSITTIFDADLIPLLEATATDESCPNANDGNLVLTITNGTLPYQYLLNGAAISLNPSGISNLSPDTYEVIVLDANGCSDSLKVVVDAAPELIVQLPADTLLRICDSLVLRPSINRPDLVDGIIWTPARWLSCADCLAPLSKPQRSIEYSILVSYGNNCIASAKQAIDVIPCVNVYAPNVFNPDGRDQDNGRFTLYGDDNVVRIIYLQVYSRWGELIFEQRDFAPNTPSMGWDGTYNGKPCNPGVYLWFAEVAGRDGSRDQHRGDVTLLR